MAQRSTPVRLVERSSFSKPASFGLTPAELRGDIFQDAFGRTPSIRFVGKPAQVSDRMGEKLSDGFVASVLSQLFQGMQTMPLFAMLAPDLGADGWRYTLYLIAASRMKSVPSLICGYLPIRIMHTAVD